MRHTRLTALASLVFACATWHTVVAAGAPPPEGWPSPTRRGGGGSPPGVQLSFLQPQVVDPAAPLPSSQRSTPPAMTLDELERIALQSNPTLVQARMAVRAAEGKYVQAGLYPNPTIGYVGDEIGNDEAAGIQGALLGQEIVTAGKLRLGRAVAGHGLQQARYAWQAQRRRVLNAVRAGYYDVLLAQRLIEVNQELFRIGQQGVEITEQLLAAQEVSRAEVLQARIEAERAKLGLEEARNRYQVDWRRLAAVLGRPEMEPAALAGDLAKNLPLLNREDALATLLARSPELAEGRAGVERARCDLALQYAERRPNLQIESGVRYDFATEFALADVAVGLPLPLFNRNQGNIISAQADLIAARHEVRRIELELRDRFAAAFGDYVDARLRVETYTQTILPAAQASLELVRGGYREGEFGYLTLLTAQRTFFSASLEYLAGLKELWARTIEVEGMLLSGGLQKPE